MADDSQDKEISGSFPVPAGEDDCYESDSVQSQDDSIQSEELSENELIEMFEKDTIEDAFDADFTAITASQDALERVLGNIKSDDQQALMTQIVEAPLEHSETQHGERSASSIKP